MPAAYGSPPSATPPPAGLFSAGAESLDAPVVTPMDTLPLSTDPVNAKHYEDLNTGCVYELDESSMTYVEVYCPDTGGGGTVTRPDTTPPPVPVIKSTATTSTGQDDGTSITNIAAAVGYASPPVGLTDLDQISRADDPLPVAGRDATGPRLDASLHRGRLRRPTGPARSTRTSLQPTALSATNYWVRASAVDCVGQPLRLVIHRPAHDGH